MPPNPFSKNLQAQLMQFLAQESLHLSPSGRMQMELLCDKAALSANTQSDKSKAKRRWTLLYMYAANIVEKRSSTEITDNDFQMVLKQFCPIWPFC